MVHYTGLCFTSLFLQVSLKERLWTRYQHTRERDTGPWALSGAAMGASERLTGLGSSTTAEDRDRREEKRNTQSQRRHERHTGFEQGHGESLNEEERHCKKTS